MDSKNIVAVMGATGLQGGSVARFLLQDNTFSVRAITRDPSSGAAKALAAQGAQVVQADYGDAASLLDAFKGAYELFGMSNYWESGVGGNGEVAQGKALVNAAKLLVGYCETKADVDDYLKASGVPRTSLYTSFRFENFVEKAPLKKRPDGTFDFPMPFITNAPLPGYSAGDTGGWVLAALLDPKEWMGKDMRIASEFLSARDMARTMTDVIGKTVHVREVSPKRFETLKGNGISEDVHAGLKFFFRFNKPQFRDPELGRSECQQIESLTAT